MTSRLVAALALVGSVSLSAQDTKKKIVVLSFDQQAVSGGLKDVFGQDNVDIGRGLSRLIAHRLGDSFIVIEVPGAIPFGTDPGPAAAAGKAAGADAVIAGSVIVYGSGSSTAGVNVGPRIGGVQLGLGRKTTVAVVQLEARLIDVASSTLLGVVPGQGNASKSGTSLYVKVPNLISPDGQIDMTKQEFGKTLIGEVTYQAVDQITKDVLGMRGRIGQMVAAPVAAPAPAMAVTPAPIVVPTGPIVYPTGPFAWTPYQFKGTEHFRYTVSRIEDGKTENGSYQLDLEPAGQGQVRMKVQGKLGTEEYSSTTTVPVASAQQGPMMGMGFGQLMSLGPIGIMLFNPAAWMVFYGHQLSVGDEWSNSSGGEKMSIKVERTCDHAGQGGLMTILRENDQVRQESCVSPTVALPLRVMTDDGSGSKMEMVLVEFRQ